MNIPEKIAGLYLRLNGFFISPHFTILLQGGSRHVYFIGVRVGSLERIDIGEEQIILTPDDGFLFCLGEKRNSRFAIVAEVSGAESANKPPRVRYDAFDYVSQRRLLIQA